MYKQTEASRIRQVTKFVEELLIKEKRDMSIAELGRAANKQLDVGRVSGFDVKCAAWSLVDEKTVRFTKDNKLTVNMESVQFYEKAKKELVKEKMKKIAEKAGFEVTRITIKKN